MDREAKAFWRERRREMLRRDRRQRGGGDGRTVTLILIGVMAAGWVAQTLAPGLLGAFTALTGPPGAILLALVVPAGLLGLLFAGLFVWLIGSQLEAVLPAWQYLVIFFGSGLTGALVMAAIGGFAGGLAPFGLAGGYVALMRRISGQGAAQWALGLLLINVLLTGFQPLILLAMAVTFGAGFGLTELLAR